jgi:hypothetical protein
MVENNPNSITLSINFTELITYEHSPVTGIDK